MGLIILPTHVGPPNCKESKKMENLIMKTNWIYKLNLELISYYKVWHVVDLQRH